jgi:hypothetical protein
MQFAKHPFRCRLCRNLTNYEAERGSPNEAECGTDHGSSPRHHRRSSHRSEFCTHASQVPTSEPTSGHTGHIASVCQLAVSFRQLAVCEFGFDFSDRLRTHGSIHDGADSEKRAVSKDAILDCARGIIDNPPGLNGRNTPSAFQCAGGIGCEPSRAQRAWSQALLDSLPRTAKDVRSP